MTFQPLANANIVIRSFEPGDADEVVSYCNCMAIAGRHTISDTP